MKNREKINQMSNEEMAELLSNSNSGEVCQYCSYILYDECDVLSCYEGILNWLNKESEDTDDK